MEGSPTARSYNQLMKETELMGSIDAPPYSYAILVGYKAVSCQSYSTQLGGTYGLPLVVKTAGWPLPSVDRFPSP